MKPLVERMDIRRRQILAGSIAGFIAAQTAMILDRLWMPTGWVHILLIGISLLGWAFFGLQLFFLFQTSHILHGEPGVQLALNDEFVRQNRRKATAAAFWAMMACQAAIILLDLLVPFDAEIAAQITLTVGVVAMIGSFLWYDREDGDA
jgi:hypothetical protein